MDGCFGYYIKGDNGWGFWMVAMDGCFWLLHKKGRSNG